MKVKVHKTNTKGRIISAKVTADGVTFDSKLEFYFYKKCKDLGIPVVVKPGTYTVLEGFMFQGKKIRDIKYSPDFYLPDTGHIIEVKGYPNDAFPLREKLFFKHLVDTGSTDKYALLKNQKEIDAFLKSIATP